MRKSGLLAVATAVVAGGLAGAAFMRPALSNANDSSKARTSVSADARADGGRGGWDDGHGGHHDGDHRDGDHHGGPGMGRPGMPPEHLEAAAEALGVSADSLAESLQSGKTIADVAKAEGVALDEVIKALVASENEELAAAVKDGRITQAQADAMKAKATERFTAIVNGERPEGGPGMGDHDGDHHGGRDGDHHGGPGMGRPGMPPEHLEAAAEALGVSADSLAESLQSGKTIADVAKAEGVALDEVIKALVASENEELAAAVKDGRITQAQADAMKAKATERFTAIVNGERPEGGPGMGDHDGDHHGGPGMGFRPGAPGAPGDGANGADARGAAATSA